MNEREQTIFQNRLLIPPLALLCAALWGSAATFIKLGYAAMDIAGGDTASQILFAGLRFTLAGVLTLLLFSAFRRRLLLPRRSAWRKIGVLAFFQTVLQYLCFYVGVAHTTGTNTAILNGCSAFFAILAATLVFHSERMTGRKALGCALGFSAVLLMNLSGLKGIRFSLSGDGMVLCSQLSYVFSVNLMKRYSRAEEPVLLSGWQFVLGGGLMIAAGALPGGRVSFSAGGAVWILLYLALLSAVAYSLWSLLMKYNDVSRISVYSFANPIFGVLFSALLLGEAEQSFSPVTLLALCFVSLGIFIVNRAPRRTV